MSSALAIRGAYGAMRVYRRRKSLYRAARAARVARAIYANRRGIRGAYKRVRAFAQARANKRARFSKTKIGEKVGLDLCKKHLAESTAGLGQNTRTLILDSLCDIPHTIDNNINGRQRHVVNLRGFKLCMEIRNNTVDPLYVNLALIMHKSALNPTTSNFFRDQTTERAKDFNNALTGLEFHCSPINTDDYVVLFHKRYRLDPNNAGTVNYSTNGKNYMNFDRYIPIKRQIRYDNNGDLAPQSGNLFFCQWYTRMFETSTTVPVPATTVSKHFVTYFRDSQQCC